MSDKNLGEGVAPDDPTNAEVFATCLRVSARLMAYEAMKYRKHDTSKAERWLLSAAQIDTLAEQYEARIPA
jgi:hypothetical protein